MVTFLLSGLWHGAAWRFVFWGGIHGAAVASDGITRGSTAEREETPGGETLLPTPRILARMIGTFTLVCFGWVFFRAADLRQAGLILHQILADLFSPAAYGRLLTTIETDSVLRSTLLLLLTFVVLEWIQRRETHGLRLGHWPEPIRWATYSLIIWGGLNLMPTDQVNPFIYFAF